MYGDAMADPLGWRYHFLHSMGLELPHNVVRNAAELAGGNNLAFAHKHFDKHPGEKEQDREDAEVRGEGEGLRMRLVRKSLKLSMIPCVSGCLLWKHATVEVHLNFALPEDLWISTRNGF